MSSKIVFLCVASCVLITVNSKETVWRNMMTKRLPNIIAWHNDHLRRNTPWLMLPNTNRCYRHKCKSSNDCCRLANICDQYAQVCIDCWYKYPCQSNGDCCPRYPICSKAESKKYGNEVTVYGICTPNIY